MSKSNSQNLCKTCLGGGIVGTGATVGFGFKKVFGHGEKRQCPVCKGSGIQR